MKLKFNIQTINFPKDGFIYILFLGVEIMDPENGNWTIVVCP